MGKYVKAYVFFRNALEQEQGENIELTTGDIRELTRRAIRIGFLNAMRMACFKISRRTDATYYAELARTYGTLFEQQPCYRRC